VQRIWQNMFMHSLSDRVTLDRNEVFIHPMKYVMPNSGAGDSKVSGYDTSSDDKDDAIEDDDITQVQMEEELSSVDEFTTPKKRKASSIERLDCEQVASNYMKPKNKKELLMLYNLILVCNDSLLQYYI
jgi:hypothetical protein